VAEKAVESPPRLLFIIAFPAPDKVPIFDELARLDPRFTVLYLQPNSPDHGWGDLPLNHDHVIASGTVSATLWVARHVLRRSFDVIVCHGYRKPPYAIAFLLARLVGIPVAIRSDTSMDLVRLDPPFKRAARRTIMRLIIGRKASAWTVGTRNAEFWLQEVGLRAEYRIQYETPVLPGGHEPQGRHREPGDPLRVVYVGRLSPEKRVEDLIRASKALDPGLDWTLTIVGKGPLHEALETLADGDPRIVFTGALSQFEVGSVLRTADVLVLPSSYEAWGLVVNEALGFGVRVLASDRVGSAADLIHESNGAVFPVGDIDALRDAIAASALHLHQDARVPNQSSAESMADAARQTWNERRSRR
jgi:glycosyltransferase involved in cell wall biosynthesis